jgi:uncharacterized protein (TIGR02246 family)
MPARAPEELGVLLIELFNAGDLDGIVALYEPEALLVQDSGQVVIGRAQIRDVYERSLAVGAGAQLAMTPGQVLAGPDVALVSNHWHITGTNADGSPMSMSGSSAEVLRRQPDGSWLYAIDNPFPQE